MAASTTFTVAGSKCQTHPQFHSTGAHTMNPAGMCAAVRPCQASIADEMPSELMSQTWNSSAERSTGGGGAGILNVA